MEIAIIPNPLITPMITNWSCGSAISAVSRVDVEISVVVYSDEMCGVELGDSPVV